jgi:hypothetical protein
VRAVVSSNTSESDSSADSPSASSISTSEADVVDGDREAPIDGAPSCWGVGAEEANLKGVPSVSLFEFDIRMVCCLVQGCRRLGAIHENNGRISQFLYPVLDWFKRQFLEFGEYCFSAVNTAGAEVNVKAPPLNMPKLLSAVQ